MEDEKAPPPVWTSDEDQIIINGRQKHDTFQALWHTEASLHPYGMAVAERRATELLNQLLLPDFLDKPPHFNPIDDSSNASAIASKTQPADSGRFLRRTKSASQHSQLTRNPYNSSLDTTSQAPSGLIVPNNDSTTHGSPDPEQVKSTFPALDTTSSSKSSAESSSSSILPTTSHINTAEHAAPTPVTPSEQSASVSVSSPKKASQLSPLSESVSSTPGRMTLPAPYTIELETENASTPPLATHSKRASAGDLEKIKKNKPVEEIDRDDRSTDSSLETEDDDQGYRIGSSSSGKKKEKKKKKKEVLSPEELKIRQKHIRMERFTKTPVYEQKSAEQIPEALLQSGSSEHSGTLGQNSSQVPSSEAPPKRRRGRPPGKKASASLQPLSSPSPATTPTSTAASTSHYSKKSDTAPTSSSSLYSTAANAMQEIQPTLSRHMDVDEPSSAPLAPQAAQALRASFTVPVVDTFPPAAVTPSPELRPLTPSPRSLTKPTDTRKADKIAKKNLSRASSTNGSGTTLDEKTHEPPAKKSRVDRWIVTPPEIHTMPSATSTQNPVNRYIATPTATLANVPDPAVASQKPIPSTHLVSSSPVSSSAPIPASSPTPLPNLMTNINSTSVASGTKSVISALYPAITPPKKPYVSPFPATPTASISRALAATTPNGSTTQGSAPFSTILSTPRSSSNPNSFSAVRTTPISATAPSTSTSTSTSAPIRRVTEWCPPTPEEIAAVPADQRVLLLNFGSPDRYSPAFFKALYGSN